MLDEKIIKDLTTLKQKIDNGKSERDKTKGALEENLKRLQQMFGVEAIEEAEKQLEKRKEALQKLEEKINKGYETLKGKYEW